MPKDLEHLHLEHLQPPHSTRAEQSILGGLLLDNAALDRVAEILQPADFYVAAHREIYTALVALIGRGQPADVVTLAEALEANGRLDFVGNLPYLGQLVQTVPSAANIASYAQIVRERADLRLLAQAGQTISDSVYTPQGRSAAAIIDAAEALVLQVGERSLRTALGEDIARLTEDALERLEQRFLSDRPLLGRSTGLPDVDERTNGLVPGNLIYVAGRPSMGKTSLATRFVEEVALQEQLPVAIFSMEMAPSQITDRLVCQVGRIDSMKYKRAKGFKDEDWERISSAVGRWNQAKLKVDGAPALSPAELRSRARRYHRELGGLGLIVVDYVQLMQADRPTDNRVNDLTEISRALKALATELQVPVVALSQLNRAVDNRAGRRPVMSDLRESGALEQDADLILFVYRDEVYDADTPDKGIAEIIIGKQRDGPVGETIRAAYHGAYTRFDSLARPVSWT